MVRESGNRTGVTGTKKMSKRREELRNLEEDFEDLDLNLPVKLTREIKQKKKNKDKEKLNVKTQGRKQ